MSILKLIANNNFITVNKTIIKTFGLEEATIIGELASELDYWTKKGGLLENNWFYSTIENIEENTGISEFKQRKALKHLVELGVIDIKIKGLPAKRYIKINEEQLAQKLNIQLYSNSIPSSLEIKELGLQKSNGNNNINNNNINNNIKEKEKKETDIDTLINEKIKDEEVKETLYDFIKMRKSIKIPVTTKGLELIINKLHKIAKDKDEAIEILNNSIMNNWRGIFELKQEKQFPAYKEKYVPIHFTKEDNERFARELGIDPDYDPAKHPAYETEINQEGSEENDIC